MEDCCKAEIIKALDSVVPEELVIKREKGFSQEEIEVLNEGVYAYQLAILNKIKEIKEELT